MGQNQSAEKTAGSRGNTLQADKDRKVNRRISVQALSHGRSQPADASASTAHAVAQGTTSHNVEKANLHQMLQSTSPELSNKTSRTERSTSRTSRGKKDWEHRPAPQQIASVPVPVPTPPPPPSGSIDIPTASTISRSRKDTLEEDHRAYEERHYGPISHLRPPRLPLPIADVPIPESPTLEPVDKSNADVPIFETDDPLAPLPAGALRRKSSMMSVTTQDEEEEVSEELQPYGVGFTGQTVPTVIEWNHPAEKVFVTGTFAAWDKKFRLPRRKSQEGKFRTTINLPPGTHHLKFFVDNQMVTSDELPTAVDFNNILVNYIEISVDDIPRQRRESTQPPSKSLAVPSHAPSVSHEPEEPYSEAVASTEEEVTYEELQAEEIPEGDFRQLIPQALVDIDLPDDDPKYKQAAQLIQDSVPPPSLPLFLSRSILNGILPVKDDSSVLALPNHTVLNHLMTSSVRNGVLATSVTTRYKKKYVTTISFKPVPKPVA